MSNLIFKYAFQMMLGVYLVLCFAIWPILVCAIKYLDGLSTWRKANSATWQAWNEIRTMGLDFT